MPGPGTPYTATEMKAIVDYLVDHNAYAQIKARFMWQEFARAGIVNRTWQSLKETFLKRILPDLHNPFYKLTAEQKQAFRNGNHAINNINRLEILTVTEDRSTTGDNDIDEEQSSTNKNAGEEVTSSKVDCRSKGSTDTVILENCYETADDIIRELESPSKSLRDKITYSEPLTPMVQEVLDDFATDEDEPRLQIVEDEVESDGDNQSVASSNHSKSSTGIRKPIRRSLSVSNSDKQNKKVKDICNSKSASPARKKIRSLKLKKTGKGWENQSTEDDEPSATTTNKKGQTDNNVENTVQVSNESGTKTVGNDSKRISHNITDTQLPNNQEQLGNKSSEEKRNSIEISTTKDSEAPDKKKPRKRGRSSSSSSQKRKIKKNNQDKDSDKDNAQEMQIPAIAISNAEVTQTYDSHPIGPNKTAQADDLTFNSHGNQPKESADITCKNNILSQNVVDETTKNDETNPNASTNDSAKNANKAQEKNNKLQDSAVNNNANKPREKNNKVQDSAVNETNANNPQEKNNKVQDSAVDETNANNPQEKNNKVQNSAVYETNANKPQGKNNKVEDSAVNETNASKVQDSNDDLRKLQNQNGLENKDDDNNRSCDDKSDKSKTNIDSLFTQDVLVLGSHSESETEHGKKNIYHSKSEALEKILGYSGGASCRKSLGKNFKNRSRRHAERKSASQNKGQSINFESGSGDSSGSDAEDFPPRRHKPPDVHDILTHEGAVFVAGRSKLFPIVYTEQGLYKDKCNYVIANGKGGNDVDTESYWKAKFLEESKKLAEEKIRADELARLLAKAKTQSTSSHVPRASCSRDHAMDAIEINSDNSKNKEDEHRQEKPVKFKFNNDLVPIEMECDPNHVSAVLEQMKGFYQSNNLQLKAEPAQSKPERQRTPTPEVSEKVHKIEKEIFQEIAEKDKVDDSNVNKRKRGRPKKTTYSISSQEIPSPEPMIVETIAKEGRPSSEGENISIPKTKIGKSIKKDAKSANEPTLEVENISIPKTNIGKSINKDANSAEETASEAGSIGRKAKSLTNMASSKEANPKGKSLSVNGNTVFLKRSNRLPQKRSDGVKKGIKSKQSTSVVIPDSEHVKYKFPVRHNSRSASESRATNVRKQYLKPRLSHSNRTSESSQGYPDPGSDLSPSPVKKKKRNVSLTRGRRRSYADSHPYQADIEYSQSQESPAKSAKNTTLNTSMYRSESFQNLMPKILDRIEQNSDDLKSIYLSLSPLHVDLGASKVEGNSSNASLASPEISVVEKLSFSRESLGETVEHASISEAPIIEDMNLSEQPPDSKCIISDVDITVNLEQAEVGTASKSAMSVSECFSSVASESLLRHIELECINDSSQEEASSDSLELRIKNLLLESGKKLQEDSKMSIMEVDEIVATIKKVRKTSSTPFKRWSRATTPLPHPVLEEHVESCRKRGRRSCPPCIKVTYCESPPRYEEPDQTSIDPKTTKQGRKKDVIKVKISKPRKSKSKERSLSTSRLSTNTDSGINDTASDMRGSNISTDLIHNHSETCLRTNECIGERSSDSITSHSGFSEIFAVRRRFTHDAFVVPSASSVEATELFSNDAQDATSLDARDPAKISEGGSSAQSIPESLITEDLSDESPSPKSTWHLFSDDENSTNISTIPNCSAALNSATRSTSTVTVHSNLRQLFPAYPVPNLSIISEASREESRKTIPDINCNSNIDSNTY